MPAAFQQPDERGTDGAAWFDKGDVHGAALREVAYFALSPLSGP
jgi:hypothetical protein